MKPYGLQEKMKSMHHESTGAFRRGFIFLLQMIQHCSVHAHLLSSVGVFAQNNHQVCARGYVKIKGINRKLLGAAALTLLVYSLAVPNFQPAHAAINESLTFQGRLRSSSQGIVPDGDYNLQFKIYEGGTESSGGTNTWTESYTGTERVRVENGYFNVRLGELTSLSSVDFSNDTLWLTMNVGGTGGTPSYDGEMTPRIRLTATPYAFEAGNADTLDDYDSQDLARLAEAANFTGALQQAGDNVCTEAGNCSIGDGVGGGNAFIQGGNSFTANATLGTNDSYALILETVGTERLRIDTSGNVGIGITPTYRLDVSGGTGIVGRFSGRVIGGDAVNDDEFVTKGQLDTAVGGAAGAGVTSVNTLEGDLTIQGTVGKVSVSSNGTDTLTLDLDANVSLLGQSIDSSEITNNTIQEEDFYATNTATDNYVLSYDAGTGGFTWVQDSTGTDTQLTEAEVEAYIFDADNTGTLSSGTLALGSLSFSGNLLDANVSDTLTIGSSSTVADGALSANVSLLGQSIEGAEITNGTVANVDLQNSSLSVNAGAGLSGGGSISLGGNTTLSLDTTYLNTNYAERESYSASLTTPGWYRIATNGPVEAGQNGGSRAGARFSVRDTQSSKHSVTTFYASYNYGNNPTITMLNRSFYNGDGVIKKIRIVEGSTYEGAAVEVYFDNGGSAGSVQFTMYENDHSSGWTAQNWQAGSVPSGFSETVLDMDTHNPVFATAANSNDNGFIVGRGGEVAAASFQGSGANLTSLNASNVSSGTLANARLSASVSLLGQSIQDGEVDNDLTISSSGSVADGALSVNVSLLGQTIESNEITDGTITNADIAADTIGATEIATDAVGSDEIASDSVQEVDLYASNAASEGFVLAYDSATQGFQWINQGDLDSSGVDSLNGLSGTVNVQGSAPVAVSTSGNNITVSIQSNGITDTELLYNTGQHLTTTSSPTFSGLTVNGNGSFSSGIHIDTQYFSDSIYNYSNGILVATDIATSDNRMIEFNIRGNSYSGSGPIDTKIQAYNYTSTGTIISTSGISEGPTFDVDAFHYNGYVYFWLEQPSSFQTMRFRLGTNNGTHKITSISNAAKPSSGVTNSVTITPMKGWYAGNDGAGSGLNADLLDGQSSAHYLNASNISAGTLADARLTANVSLLGQSIQDGEVDNDLTVSSSGSVADGALSANVSLLGQSIEGSEITDGTIEGIDLEVTNAATDGYALTYDSSSGGFTWAQAATSSTAFMQNGNSFGTLATLGTNDLNALAFETNGSEVARFDTAGNFGIGVTNPSESLEVAGNIQSNIGHVISGSSNGALVLNAGPDSLANGGIYFRATDVVGDTSSYTSLGYWDSSGRLGVGTTSPGATLHVANTGSIPTLQLGRTTGQPTIKSEAGESLIIDSNGGINYLNYYVADHVSIANGGGNVGIGTTSPGSKLDVNGNINLQGGSRTVNFGTAAENGPHGFNFANELFGYYRTSPNTFSFEHSDGSEILTVSRDSKNVTFNGSGETISGGTNFLFSSNSGFIDLRPSDNIHGIILRDYTGGSTSWGGIRSTTAGDLQLTGDGAYDQLHLDTSGRIGVSNTSPSYDLDISGTLNVWTGTSSLQVKGGRVEIGGESIDNDVDFYGAGQSPGNPGFRFEASSGYIGINRPSPVDPLHIHGGSEGVIQRIDATSPSSSRYFLQLRDVTNLNNKVLISTSGVGRSDGGWTTPADYAEYFYSNDRSLESGDLVTVASTQKRDSSKVVSGTVRGSRLGDSAIGVISTKPGILGALADDVTDGSADYEKDPNHKQVGLLGQVPVKVTDENGIIKGGDGIRPSAKPKLGAKAVGSGQVVAKALQKFDPSTLTCKPVESEAAITWPKDKTGTAQKSTCYRLPDGTHVGKILAYVKTEYVTDTTSLQNASYGELIVNQANVSELNVSGNTTMEGDLVVKGVATFTNDVLVKGELKVKELTTETNIVVGEHVLSASTSAPTANKGIALGANGLVDVDGTDTAGTVTVKTDEGTTTTGELVHIEFAQAYERTPRIALTPFNSEAAQIKVYLERTDTGFSIRTEETPPINKELIFDYIVVGSSVVNHEDSSP